MHAISFTILFAMLIAASSASAVETCKVQPKSQWQSIDQVKKAAIDLGFSKVILEDNCYEVVTLDANGKIVGVQFDPVTLKLVKVEDPR